MNEDKIGLLVFLVMVVCFLVSIYSNIIKTDIIEEMRQKAVERGAAEWVVDQATGDTEFVWISLDNDEK